MSGDGVNVDSKGDNSSTKVDVSKDGVNVQTKK
jgi:hypothetical protein